MTKEEFISICIKEIQCSYLKAESMWYESTEFSEILPGIINPVIRIGEGKKGKYLLIYEKGHPRISTSFDI